MKPTKHNIAIGKTAKVNTLMYDRLPDGKYPAPYISMFPDFTDIMRYYQLDPGDVVEIIAMPKRLGNRSVGYVNFIKVKAYGNEGYIHYGAFIESFSLLD
jgi:hypothetical protein